jgi:hypothetical protein
MSQKRDLPSIRIMVLEHAGCTLEHLCINAIRQTVSVAAHYHTLSPLSADWLTDWITRRVTRVQRAESSIIKTTMAKIPSPRPQPRRSTHLSWGLIKFLSYQSESRGPNNENPHHARLLFTTHAVIKQFDQTLCADMHTNLRTLVYVYGISSFLSWGLTRRRIKKVDDIQHI